MEIEGRENYLEFIRQQNIDGFQFSKRTSKYMEGSIQTESNSGLKIGYFGHPFIKIYTSYSQCSHGQKYYKNKNQKHHDQPTGKKKRFRIQDTKKMNCPAVMKVCRIIYFPEFCLKKDVTCFKRKKTEMMNNLRKKLISGEVEGKEKYYIFVSHSSIHNHPVMTTYLNQKLDDSIQNEIKKLVDSGITSTFFIKAFLKKFVLELPNGHSISKICKAFYPSKKIISNYVAKFTLENRVNNIDHVSVVMVL